MSVVGQTKVRSGQVWFTALPFPGRKDYECTVTWHENGGAQDRTRWKVLIWLVVVGLVGCQSGKPPVIDTTPPQPPQNLRVTVPTDFGHSLVLHWSPNSEPDLAGYHVY